MAKKESLAHLLADEIAKLPQDATLEKWYEQPFVREAYELLARRFISDELPTSPPPHHQQRGIVMPGGGAKYFPSLWVGINRLRKFGCHLPIEVWHLGEVEMDAAMKRLLSPLNVVFCDAHEYRKNWPMRILNGWELKPYALTHSLFNQILFMDADCAPTRNPEYLFDLDQYKETGTIFWPDYPHWTLREKAYQAFGLKPPDTIRIQDDFQQFGKRINLDDGVDIPVESGQMLIDRSKCYRALALAKFFCENSDFYFHYVHGDKEAFHLAWRRLNQPYAMPQQWPHWDRHTVLQYDFKGDIVFAHRSTDKWRLGGNVTGTGLIPDEDECFALVKTLGKVWSGHVWENSQPTPAENKVMKSLVNKKYFYHRVGHDARLLELLPKNLIGQGQAQYEDRWSLFIIDGKSRLVINGEEKPTCFLEQNKHGVWEGNWLINEKMPVKLALAE